LAVAAAAQALALPATWLRVFAIVALGIFGLTLLVPAFGHIFERVAAPLARLGNTNASAGAQRGGFGGGLLIGGGLGLVWAPCVGPIIASIIALTATAGLTLEGVAITLAYAIGAGLPMLAIAYGTRGFASRARKLNPRSALIQRAFGGLALLTCVALLLGWDARVTTFALRNLPPEWNAALIEFESNPAVQREIDMLDERSTTSQGAQPELPAVAAQQPTVEPTVVVVPTTPPRPEPTVPPTPKPGLALEDMGPAPELVGLTNWINSEPLTLQELRGKVVVIDFWTFGCYNCRNTRPHVRALYDKYKDQGLEILGIHTPEFAYEKVPDNVRSAAKEQGVIWPIALDQEFKTWRAFGNRYWPAFYVIDANGHLRYKHFGEGRYEHNEKVVQQLLNEARSASK
jgi:thiol-disulfide isomerase/thioredoxin